MLATIKNRLRGNLVTKFVPYLLVFVLLFPIFWYLFNQITALQNILSELTTRYQVLLVNQEKLKEDYAEALYQEHLASLERKKLEETKKQIEQAYQKLKSQASKEKLVKIETVHSLYQDTLSKIERNKNVKLDTSQAYSQINDWGVQFLNQEFDQLQDTISSANNNLDQQYQDYLASLPTPTPIPTPRPTTAPTSPPPPGYAYQTVFTSRGNFNTHLIKLPLAQVQVKTLTANEKNCSNNCPTKSLADYVSENNAYAGIHGTYFCPPDYSACVNKVNSYDFAVYNSNLGKWLNEHALSWNDLGLATFNGNTPHFYRESKAYDKSAVTAGISNYPTLLENGQVVVDENLLSAYQKSIKAPRGAIGVDDENLYLVIATEATVPDIAYVMQSLGAKNALNLDGGGSSAMYISGTYKVGPGRSLPNAIVLLK